MLELSSSDDADYPLQFSIATSTTFFGGTGSTPTISADGKKVVVSDAAGRVLALDAETLETLWGVNVGEQLAASVAVAPQNNELFAVSKTNVYMIHEVNSSYAEIAWTADLSAAFPQNYAVNALTPLIVANGVVVSIGAVMGEESPGNSLLTNVGFALLDRLTGKVSYFAQGREESISVTVAGNDGSYYSGNSPVRRAVTRAVFGNVLPPLIGGVSKYKPIRRKLLARDAACSARAFAQNAAKYTKGSTNMQTYQDSAQDDARQVKVLISQAHANIESKKRYTVRFAKASWALDEAAEYITKAVDSGSLSGHYLRQAVPYLGKACDDLKGK